MRGGAEPQVWLSLGAAWIASSVLCGLLLALLVRRIHPGLSFYRTWLFYAVLTGFLVATVLLVGLL